MTSKLPSGQSLFTMSALNGLLAIRRYTREHPGILLQEVIDALKHVTADDAYHDYHAALLIEGLLKETPSIDDIPSFFGNVLSVMIREVHPWWSRLATYGRERVRQALSANEAQCFDAAELFRAPTQETLLWWDTLAQGVRAAEDFRRLEQGRAAELLTVEYETKRLLSLGIPNKPRWISLDDNAAGYDVHSYESGSIGPVAKLIEVKSCASQPYDIFLTRNEWETAVERTTNYRFHIWLLPEQKLIELSPGDLEKHVPQDRGSGRWQVALIHVRGLQG